MVRQGTATGDGAVIAVRSLWHAVRTPLAAAADVLGLALLLAGAHRVGLLSPDPHHAVEWKLLLLAWLLGCATLTASATYRLYQAVAARRAGRRGQAAWLAEGARTLLSVSAALAVAPAVVVSLVVLVSRVALDRR